MKNTVPLGTARALLVIIAQPFWVIGFDTSSLHIEHIALRSRRSHGLVSWAIAGVAIARTRRRRRGFSSTCHFPFGCFCRIGRHWAYVAFRPRFQAEASLLAVSP